MNTDISIRTQRIIRKCQTGSVIEPAAESLKQQYAKKNGLVYRNNQFFKIDGNGNFSDVTVLDSELQDFKKSSFLNNDTALKQIGSGIDFLSQSFMSVDPNVQNQSVTTQAINTGYDTAAQAVSAINPLAGTIMKAGGFASDALTAAGIGTDQQTVGDQILDSKFLKLTPIGLINAIGASNTQKFSMDEKTIEKIGGSYGGTVEDIQDAVNKADKSYGLFSSGARNKANRFISEMRNRQNKMAKIASTVSDQRESVDMMGDVAAQAYSSQIAGGFDARYFKAKEGGKFAEPEEAFVPEILMFDIERITPVSFETGGLFDEVINPNTGNIETWNPDIITVNEFKQGGKVEKQLDAPEIKETSQQNVIPEGALHKNKHHMENSDKLTKKGIPVVDSEHQQHAEIEKNEIIFTREVTEKLEELYKIYYSEESKQSEKEQAAIDAGKLLTKEIMLNTDDRTGLIDTLQQGGSLAFKKPAYKTWLATVNPNFLSKNYDLETAYNVLPFDVLERWRKESLKPKPSEKTDWHLPSVHQLNDSTIMFLKRGRTAKDNPELQGEFDFYKNSPEFSKEWKMVFNPSEQRWYYRRQPTN